MTEHQKVAETLRREAIRLWRKGGQLLRASESEDLSEGDVRAMLRIEADDSLKFAAKLEALAGKLRKMAVHSGP